MVVARTPADTNSGRGRHCTRTTEQALSSEGAPGPSPRAGLWGAGGPLAQGQGPGQGQLPHSALWHPWPRSQVRLGSPQAPPRQAEASDPAAQPSPQQLLLVPVQPRPQQPLLPVPGPLDPTVLIGPTVPCGGRAGSEPQARAPQSPPHLSSWRPLEGLPLCICPSKPRQVPSVPGGAPHLPTQSL